MMLVITMIYCGVSDVSIDNKNNDNNCIFWYFYMNHIREWWCWWWRWQGWQEWQPVERHVLQSFWSDSQRHRATQFEAPAKLFWEIRFWLCLKTFFKMIIKYDQPQIAPELTISKACPSIFCSGLLLRANSLK